MDQHQLTTLLRSLSHIAHRRDALLGLASIGWSLNPLRQPAPVAATRRRKRRKKKKKKNQQRQQPPPLPPLSCVANCSDRTCGNDGCGGSCGSCQDQQVCRGGTCCTPEPLTFTCLGICGAAIDNCGQSVSCPGCLAGQTCLSNGRCTMNCQNSKPCEDGCKCLFEEGTGYCCAPVGCAEVPRRCTLMEDCPPGFVCLATGCGSDKPSERRCVPLCFV